MPWSGGRILWPLPDDGMPARTSPPRSDPLGRRLTRSSPRCPTDVLESLPGPRYSTATGEPRGAQGAILGADTPWRLRLFDGVCRDSKEVVGQEWVEFSLAADDVGADDVQRRGSSGRGLPWIWVLLGAALIAAGISLSPDPPEADEGVALDRYLYRENSSGETYSAVWSWDGAEEMDAELVHAVGEKLSEMPDVELWVCAYPAPDEWVPAERPEGAISCTTQDCEGDEDGCGTTQTWIDPPRN